MGYAEQLAAQVRARRQARRASVRAESASVSSSTVARPVVKRATEIEDVYVIDLQDSDEEEVWDLTGEDYQTRERRQGDAEKRASHNRRKRRDEEPDHQAKKRKTKDGLPKVQKERRGAVYRPTPSRAVLTRLERTFSHRLYLVDRRPQSGEELERGFVVMGTGGNMYDVVIGKDPRCNCPDYLKRGGDPCKHIFFVLHRVLGVARNDPKLWQKRLLSSEVHEIFSHAHRLSTNDNLVAESAVRRKYAEISLSQESDNEKTKEERRPLTDSCPICMEEFEKTRQEATTWCKTCKNNLHKDCLNKWLQARSSGNAPCPFCRQPWVDGGTTTEQGTEGYINLAHLSSRHAKKVSLSELYPDTYLFMSGERGRNAVLQRHRL